MKKSKKLHSVLLASAVLILFLVLLSSSASAATAQYAYITNSGDTTLSVVDTATNKVIATVNIGYNPYGVAVSPDGKKVYAASDVSDAVSVIDTATNKVTGTIPVGSNPWGVAINSAGTKLYVANEGSGTLSVINTATNKVTATVGVGNYPCGVAVAGTKAYVVNTLDNTVSVVDTTTNKVTATISVGNIPTGIAANPAGTKLYVTNEFDVSVIDTATNKVTSTISVGTHPWAVAVTGTRAYVTNYNEDGTVSVINTATNKVISTISVGSYPIGIAVTPDGNKVYVANEESGTASVISTSTNKVIATVSVGKEPVAFGQFIGYVPVTATTKPVAAFSASPTSGNSPLSVTFTDKSTGTPTSWKWSFGDGTTSTSKSPTHTYSKAGTYTVTLTATNSAGSNTATKSSYITVTTAASTAPTADFSASSTSGTAPLTVKFTDKSTGSPTYWKWNFGDGSDIIEAYNPTHTYTKAGTYTVKETVSNAAGRDTEIKTSYITVTTATSKSPVAAFSASPTSGNSPLSVTFTDKSTGSPTSWKWSFGDGTTSTSKSPTHTYSKAGTYTVTLTATNSAGSNTATKSSYITVTTAASTAPTADFSASSTSGTIPLTVKFTDKSTGSPTSWKWSFGDGSDLVTGYNPTHTYTKAGTYTVKETVSNAVGKDTEIKTSYITVTAASASTAPTADFSASSTSGAIPLTVKFTDKSTGSPTYWKWSFGDGSDIIEAYNPTHTYTKAGTYTVKETVSNAAGRDTEIKTSYITVTTATSKSPVAAFSASPTSGNSPLSVTFTDQSTGTPTSWKWSFGDGTTSTSKSPTHTYSKAGKYTVTLTATNSAGSNTATKSSYITVTTAASTAPTADFSASSTSGTIPLTVKFTDKSTGSPTYWKWSFGDGSDLVTGYNPTHTYTKAGTYTVKETVSNAVGKDTEIKTSYITVTAASASKAPVADFSASSTSGTIPLTVKFTDKSTGSPTSWKWSFGDGSSLVTGYNPTHTYTKAGTYTVKETVSNAVGKNTKIKTSYITVKAAATSKPVASFSASSTSGTAPLSVTFTDKSTGSPTSWKWSFGDGTTSTSKNPTHTYSKAGKYTVTLTATNSAGSTTATKSSYITVTTATLKAPSANFWGSPKSGKAPLKVIFTESSTGSPTSWKWNFGDGTYSTVRSPTHTYSKAGKYTVILTATNSGGSTNMRKYNYITVSSK